MSLTRSANSDCSIASRRSCSWADRWSSMAGRIRSRRSSSAPRSSMVRMCSTSPTSMRRSTARAARARPTRRRRWSSSSASCWPIRPRATAWPRRRRAWSASSAARWNARSPRSSPICCSCGSRWEPRMREPAFWHRPSSWTSHLLRPLGTLYGAVAAQRLLRKGFDAGIPVLCVGNYHLGGAGKTPTVLALAKLLRELGETPVVLSRGYGGRLRGPIMVDPARHGAADVGDEPLMLARTVPVAVARDRLDGVALARSQRASVILLDDGFQNPAIAKDASLIVIDGERGLGNAWVFPAGPLRAPLAPQLARTDALIVIGDGNAAKAVAAEIAAQGKPVLSAHLKPEDASVAALRGKRVLAFAGIGDPDRFFRTLRASGIDVVRERAFPDHHPFSKSEIENLTAEAKGDALTLVTTEKDLARLRGSEGAEDILPFPVTLEFDDAAGLRKFLSDRLFKAREKKFTTSN